MKKLLVSIFLSVVVLVAGCSQQEGTTTGNPIVSISLSGHVSSASMKVSTLAVSSLTYCFKRLRFKLDGETTDADPSVDEDNVDLDLGEVTITGSEQDLVAVEVPPGTYKRVEFDLEDHCTSGKSLQVTNGSGSFSTDERITIKFEGTFVVSESDVELPISMQAIIDELDAVTADNQVKTRAEAASGTF
jgi:hypothetical protein